MSTTQTDDFWLPVAALDHEDIIEPASLPGQWLHKTAGGAAWLMGRRLSRHCTVDMMRATFLGEDTLIVWSADKWHLRTCVTTTPGTSLLLVAYTTRGRRSADSYEALVACLADMGRLPFTAVIAVYALHPETVPFVFREGELVQAVPT